MKTAFFFAMKTSFLFAAVAASAAALGAAQGADGATDVERVPHLDTGAAAAADAVVAAETGIWWTDWDNDRCSSTSGGTCGATPPNHITNRDRFSSLLECCCARFGSETAVCVTQCGGPSPPIWPCRREEGPEESPEESPEEGLEEGSEEGPEESPKEGVEEGPKEGWPADVSALLRGSRPM